MNYSQNEKSNFSNEFLCLKNEDIEVLLTPIGASVRSLFVRDKNGSWRDIVLGYETEDEYQNNSGSLGAVVGRYAGRISGAGFTLAGGSYELDRNDGENCLHGGYNRYETRKFRVVSQSESEITFEIISPDGDQGFPGNAVIRVKYSLGGGPALHIEYEAETDRATLFNLTNHAYFQLDSHDAGSVSGHTLQLDSDRYIVFDEAGIPTGELRRVDDSGYDLRCGRAMTAAYDNCFVLNERDRDAPAATLIGGESGIAMEVYTDRPVMVVYTAEHLDVRNGKGHTDYSKHGAVCLETEGYPDAMNRPEFPQEIYTPERGLYTFTTFRFKTLEKQRKKG